MAPEQLLHEGSVVPSRIVVSHEEQLIRLKASCPEALPHAVVAGDPCFDRMLTSRVWRDHYRTALGLRDGQRLVVVASTWGPHSLLESRPDLIARLLADLPADDYRVAAVVHPGVWYDYGPWQVATWLADCRRAGLLLIPPHEGWRAALVAADCVIGDHGSVTLYGAAIGTPTLLAAFHADDIDPGTAMATLGRRATTLRTPYRDAIEGAVAAGPIPGIADEAVAMPGESARLLRDLMYELMNLTPIPHAPRVPPVPLPAGWDDTPVPPALLVAVTAGPGHYGVARYPVEVAAVRTVALADPHLVVDDAEPDHRLTDIADIVVRRPGSAGRTAGLPQAEAAAAYPRSLCVADVSSSRCVVTICDGRTVEFECGTGGIDPAVLASIVHHHVETSTPLPGSVTVNTPRSHLTAKQVPAT